MTNNEIIFNERVNLMEQGLLKGSGTWAKVEKVNGEVVEIELPEEIHTFQAWKERGYAVKKGEKSQIKFSIWKCTTKKDEDGNEEKKMFMKLSAFFTASQVEPLKA